MKVKVRRIAAPYQDVPTESLQAICRNHAHDKLHVRVSVEQLYDIMDELARRRQESGADPFRSNEEAWAEFVKYYMPKDPDSLIDPTTGIPLTPSWHGEDCMGNGEHPDLECCCDECDYYLACFPMEKTP